MTNCPATDFENSGPPVLYTCIDPPCFLSMLMLWYTVLPTGSRYSISKSLSLFETLLVDRISSRICSFPILLILDQVPCASLRKFNGSPSSLVISQLPLAIITFHKYECASLFALISHCIY